MPLVPIPARPELTTTMSDKDSTMDPGWTSLPVEKLESLRVESKQQRALARTWKGTSDRQAEELDALRAENGRLLERYHRANNYAAELETERLKAERLNERLRARIAELEASVLNLTGSRTEGTPNVPPSRHGGQVVPAGATSPHLASRAIHVSA